MVESRGSRRIAIFFFVAAFLVLLLGRWLGPVDRVYLTVAAPFEAAASGVTSSVAGLVSGVVDGPGYRSANADLNKKIGTLVHENLLLQEAAHENALLKRMLKFSGDNPHLKLAAGRVIGTCPNNTLDACVIIDKGARDRVRAGMTVLDQNGYFVGRITQVGSNFSKVLLLISPSSSVGALDETTRARGLVEGQLAERPLLNYVVASDVMHVGDFIVTSGELNLFPRILLLGQVVAVHHDNAAVFQTADIRPAADFQHLELIQVVTSFDPAQPSHYLTGP